jgi:anti-anti-sigma factor
MKMTMKPSGIAVEPGPDPGLAVESRRVGSAAVVALSGELDLDSVPLLNEHLDAALGSPETRVVVVDCEHLAFCDSTGLNALLAARLRAEEGGPLFRLAALPRSTERMFDITGASDVFELYADLGQALAAR